MMRARTRLVFVLAACIVGSAEAAAPFVVGIGDKAPEAAGIVLQGPPGTKLSSLRGKIVLVDFWASYCGPCLQSMPELNAMRAELFREGYAGQFEILSVATDSEVEKARRFLQRVQVDFPVVADQIGIAIQTYKLWRLPATYLVDRRGHVSMIYAGYGPGYTADVKQRVLALLKQPS